MRHIAIESGAFVVSVPQYIPRSAFPDDFPVPLPDREVFGRGGAAIVEPGQGDVIAGPLYDQEGMVIADCDLREGLHAKRWFDAVGHYSREDVLMREIRTAPEAPMRPVDQDGSSSNSSSPTTTSSPGSKPAR
jgi:nitrilase